MTNSDVIFFLGSYGSQSDGGIFRDSIFGQKFENGTMPLPLPREIPQTNIKMPFVLLGDQAFPLKNYLLRPYAGRQAALTLGQKIFNYRLSRCRRVIENAFGILVARWRLLKATINASPERVDLYVRTCVVLHNFCKMRGASNGESAYCPPDFTDNGDDNNGGWRQETENLPSVNRMGSNNATRGLYNLRDQIKEYFMNLGQLPWQLQRVTEGEDILFPRNFD